MTDYTTNSRFLEAHDYAHPFYKTELQTLARSRPLREKLT